MSFNWCAKLTIYFYLKGETLNGRKNIPILGNLWILIFGLIFNTIVNEKLNILFTLEWYDLITICKEKIHSFLY